MTTNHMEAILAQKPQNPWGDAYRRPFDRADEYVDVESYPERVRLYEELLASEWVTINVHRSMADQQIGWNGFVLTVQRGKNVVPRCFADVYRVSCDEQASRDTQVWRSLLTVRLKDLIREPPKMREREISARVREMVLHAACDS